MSNVVTFPSTPPSELEWLRRRVAILEDGLREIEEGFATSPRDRKSLTAATKKAREKINGLLRGAFPHVTDASEGAKAQEPTKPLGKKLRDMGFAAAPDYPGKDKGA
jgi:hypothetical protein